MSNRKEVDIYGSVSHKNKQFHQPTEDQAAPVAWRTEYLRHKMWTTILLAILIVFMAGVAFLVYKNYQSTAPEFMVEYENTRRKTDRISTHRLSFLTDWVIDYKEPIDKGIENVDFDSYWLKRASYHFVNGEQSFYNQDFPAARKHLNAALEIFPNLKGVAEMLGQIDLAEERYESAIKFLEKAAAEKSEPDYAIYSNLGAANIQINEHKKAEEYILKAIEINPLSPDSYQNLAELYNKIGETQKASENYEKYLELVPNDMNVMQSYAILMINGANWEKANQLLSKLTDEFPNVAPFWFLRAQVEMELKNNGGAIVALQRAVKLVDSSYAFSWLSKTEFRPLHNNQHFKQILSMVEEDLKNQ